MPLEARPSCNVSAVHVSQRRGRSHSGLAASSVTPLVLLGQLLWSRPNPAPDLPQTAFSQLRLTPGLRKVLFATALGTVALALAAHQLKRRRRKKKQAGPEVGGQQLGAVPLPFVLARKAPSVKKGGHHTAVGSQASAFHFTASSTQC